MSNVPVLTNFKALTVPFVLNENGSLIGVDALQATSSHVTAFRTDTKLIL